MNTKGIQFKKFKQQFQTKNTKVKTATQKPIDPIYQIPKFRQQTCHRSPQRPPTSFRELSGSRQKNKLFSGKKAALENKLNTLRSNEKHTGFQVQAEEKCWTEECQSAKKQGLFTKLLTSRSPNSVKKGVGFDDSGSTNTASDTSGISFSAFKGVNLGENQNCANFNLQKKVSVDQSNQQKGLKFRGFPHKRTNVNNLGTKGKAPGAPIIMLAQGPLISQKGHSRSKSHKKDQLTQKQDKNILKPTLLSKKTSQPPENSNQYRKPSTFEKVHQNQYGLECRISGNFSQSSDEVIRSREGSLVFDMSPTLF